MKVKLKGLNGAIALVVSGSRQEIIITEEDGCFAIEVADTVHNYPVLVPESASTTVPVPVTVPEEEQSTDMPSPSNEGLFKKLVSLRKSLAVANEVPPYLIFHDKTLHEMVDKMPLDMQAMGHISGVGQAKLEKYGPIFLDVINNVAVGGGN